MWNARAHEAKRVCLSVKHIFTNGGDCKGWSPMTPKCTPTLGIAFLWELWMFKTLVGKANNVATPLWGKFEDKTRTPKSGNLESFGTPKDLELDCRGQNTLPWGVLYTVGKVLKSRCRKWPRMSHSDICNTSYGRKEGQKSNWQFDSRPLKIRNRPDPSVCKWSATHRQKAFEESYKFALDLIPIRGLSWELWAPKVPRVQTGTISGLPLGSLGTKSYLDASAVEKHREYYMGEGGGFPWI
jgi:hypothetical protein